MNTYEIHIMMKNWQLKDSNLRLSDQLELQKQLSFGVVNSSFDQMP